MKIARYLAHGQISYGAVEGDSVNELSASPFEDFTITDHTHKISEVQLLAPCEPSKVLAVGLNYSSHLHDRPAPEIPMIFFKTPNSVIGPGDTIIRPKGTEKLDAEAELVIVVKDRCHKLTKANAMEHILGYTCGNDVSAATGSATTVTGGVPSHLTHSRLPAPTSRPNSTRTTSGSLAASMAKRSRARAPRT